MADEPDVDLALPYRAPHYPVPQGRRHNGACRLRVWLEDRPRPLVVFTELDDNTGVSITNAAEHLYAYAQRLYPGAVVVEHYPHSGTGARPSFSHVTVTDGRASWAAIHPDLLPPL